MPPTTLNTRARLLRRRAQLLKELERVAPDLMEEFHATELGLTATKEPEQTYAKIKSQRDAVKACLELNNRWMDKHEIANDLFKGGYLLDPVHGPRMLADAMGKMVSRKQLASKPKEPSAGKKRGEILFGLVHWLEEDPTNS